MTLHDDLVAAKALIADPARWVKDPGELGKCYCAVTAITGVFGASRLGTSIHTRKRDAWEALASALPEGWGQVGIYNDDPTTTHADIMALFDRAIAASISPNRIVTGSEGGGA